ncbi:MAG TPA: histidine phosphatase family protein [Spirochaetota bacterium]|nr:histidine phosphatase family protein [Spirochaetota bacterium]HPS87644.1 histidine phosphatase family protein [Spirochaetota bacterium]
MKTVYLFRHGDSEEGGLELDYCRKLTEEGKARSAAMAEYIKKTGCRPDLIITSEALRAKTTACIIAKTFGYPETDIVTEDILYETKKVNDIIPLILNCSTKISSIMIVGHNPLLSDFIKYISSSSSDINMKKSSVVRIDFKTDEWNSITPGSGNISFYKVFVNGGIIDASEDHS